MGYPLRNHKIGDFAETIPLLFLKEACDITSFIAAAYWNSIKT